MPSTPTIPKTGSELGTALRAARLEAGYALLQDAAEAGGVSPSRLCNLELHANNPSWITVAALIVRLRLPLERFLPAESILAAADRLRRRNGHHSNEETSR